MRNYKYLSYMFIGLAILLSNVMCATVSYEYCALQWCGRYGLCSAPARVAFLYIIPYAAGIVICVILAWFFLKKYRKSV